MIIENNHIYNKRHSRLYPHIWTDNMIIRKILVTIGFSVLFIY